MQPDHDVLVIGGGFSGIGAGIALDRAGFRNWTIAEAGDGVGGAWHWNKYPGIAVDFPSFSYQFSFERMASWSRVYAPGAELEAYAEHCVEKYGLRSRIRLGCAVTATRRYARASRSRRCGARARSRCGTTASRRGVITPCAT